MSTKIAIELKLSDEDRNAIISEVEARLKGVAEAAVKNAGKGATTGKGKNATATKKNEEPAADESGDDGFEDTDGEADASADGDEAADDDDFEGGEEETTTVTKNDVQAALRDYAAVTSKAEAMKVLERAGKCKGLSALEEKNFAAVVKAANEATAKAKKAKK